MTSPQLNPPSILTARLELIASTVHLVRAAADDDHAAFSSRLNAKVPVAWPPEVMADGDLARLVGQLEADPAIAPWFFYFAVLRDSRTLIGGAGFYGPPQDGRVEVGYAVLDEFQNKGYASEAVRALVAWAFDDQRVTRIAATSFPHLSASLRVMEKCGMVQAATITGHESEEGVVQYELTRSRWREGTL